MNSVQVLAGVLVGIFIGVALVKLTLHFRKPNGVMFMTEVDGETNYTLQLEEEPGDLMKRRYIIFKVLKRSH